MPCVHHLNEVVLLSGVDEARTLARHFLALCLRFSEIWPGNCHKSECLIVLLAMQQ